MKLLPFLCVLFVTLLFIPNVVLADWRWSTKSTDFRLYGWMQGRSTWTDQEGLSAQFTSTRLRFHADKSRWHLYAYAELVDADKPDANWLQEINVTYDIAEEWHITAGRLFRASAYITPPPFLLETSRYPRTPFPLYAYGVRITGKAGISTVRVDITGMSNASFQTDDSFDRAESAVRIEIPIGAWKVSATSQVANELGLYAVDVKYSSKCTVVRGATWSTSKRTAQEVGAYVFVSQRIQPRLELHGQIDSIASESTILTGGLRLLTLNEFVTLTVDYERTDKKGRWLSRLQWRF